MNTKYIPDTFEAVIEIKEDKFTLRKLTPKDVEKDYKAVMSSKESLRKIFSANDSWPKDTMTIEENLIDLKWHEEEFNNRSSFSYTLLNPDESECIGCVYIFPWPSKQYDSSVFYWVIDSYKKKGFEKELDAYLRSWLDKDWPFNLTAFPGREMSFDSWDKIKSAKYD